MSESKTTNKFRKACELLQRGRDHFVDELADEVVERGEDFLESPYLLGEFLENQGTRLHFLGLLIAHLEQTAEAVEMEQAMAAIEQKASSRASSSKPRAASKKLPNQRTAAQRKRNAEET